MKSSHIRLTETEINRIFDSFTGKKVLVIGDVMLDAYWFGKVDRISPEAPVPVVNVQNKEYRLGGAANVALNLKRLGAAPIICSVIGKDVEGDIFLKLLGDESIGQEGVVFSDTRPTTVKTRIISGKNQLLRVDSEDDSLVSLSESLELASRIKILLRDADLVVFEDYDKGVISPGLIEDIVNEANKLKIPVAVDPKKRNFMAYNNVTLFKPNMRELAEGLKLDINTHTAIDLIESAAYKLKDKLQIVHAMITLSEMGVYVTGKDKDGYLIPAHVRDIYDVSGAGDTVISVAALALLANVPIDVVAALANLAGGLVCEKVGVVPVEREELMREAIAIMGA
jgi:rfaE bifunctional protein kinase chain/domain